MKGKMKETEKVELKKSTAELKEALVSIVAMLNKHQKGELYFGMKNDGGVVGQNVTEKTLREVSQAIATKIDPVIYPLVEEIVIKGKACVKVQFDGKDIPYFVDGRAYIRVEDEDRKLNKKELEEMIIKRRDRQSFGYHC
jgi:ATP-dependent DNA helicase RecG